ncbi:LysM peptidoglycan-binding domain-containing protein [Timonella sp. A28]|uniref:LysM peptidoglycan-binding domain-containing protein n=1 Tax=Timonella sp. A28 TaxID=3442640 RepID=UPI003EBD3CFF
MAIQVLEGVVVDFPLTEAARKRVHRARYGITGLRGLRLTRRGRVLIVALALLCLLVPVVVAATAHADEGVVAVEVLEHPVAVGETLWTIARGINPGVDNRDVVSDIMNLNNMAVAKLRAGEVILLPMYEK